MTIDERARLWDGVTNASYELYSSVSVGLEYEGAFKVGVDRRNEEERRIEKVREGIVRGKEERGGGGGDKGAGGGKEVLSVPVRVIRVEEGVDNLKITQKKVPDPTATLGSVVRSFLDLGKDDEGLEGMVNVINGVWEVPWDMEIGQLWRTVRMGDRFLYVVVK